MGGNRQKKFNTCKEKYHKEIQKCKAVIALVFQLFMQSGIKNKQTNYSQTKTEINHKEQPLRNTST